jgi:hypothetical protein
MERPPLSSFTGTQPPLESFTKSDPLDGFLAASQPKKDLLQKTGDVVNKIFPGKQVGQAIGTIAGLGVEKVKGVLGGVDNSQTYDTSAPSLLQVGADVVSGALQVAGGLSPTGASSGIASTLIGGVKGIPAASTIIGKTAQLGTIGAVGGGARSVAEGNQVDKVIEDTKSGAVTGAITGATLGLAEKGISKMSDFIAKTGDKIQTSVIKPSQADIKDGFSIETVKKYNLGGSLQKMFEKTQKTLDNLSKELNKKLASSNTSIDLNKVYEKTIKRLLGNKLENFGSNTQMESAIEKLRNEILSVSGNNGLVSIPEAQLVKRASGHFGAWTFGNPTPEATASQKVYNTFYSEIKKAIEDTSPEGVKQINQEISKLIPVMNAVIRRIPVNERNSVLSLTDIISLSAGAIDPRALSLSLLNLASKSGTIGSVLSKTPDLGKLIEKIEPAIRQAVAR